MLGHNRKMTGAECLAEMLNGYGVTHVFMVPAVLRRTFVEMERRGTIKRIHTHGEKSAAYMADGYARVSRMPGICMAQVMHGLLIRRLSRSPAGASRKRNSARCIRRSMTCRHSSR